ncbi:HAD family hydrolase [Gordonia malaquae]|uniref:HAD family hydrolase n=1 Tax=Gordonia malaquae TaxID=410332 RepID=UPI0030FF31B4
MDRQLPSGIRVVVFDVGETIVDESRMWTEQAESAGVTPFTLMGLIGALIERNEPHHAVWDILGTARPTFNTEIRSSDLYPDALDCLRSAKEAGFAVGIAGNQPSGATACLRTLGFDADFVASSTEWGVAKPSAGFFSRIVEFSCVEPEEVLYVGDRLDNDIVPAAELGMRTALLRRGPWGQIHSQRADSSRADLRVGSLSELASMFRSHDSGAH